METFVYRQLQSRLNILFTVISFSVLHRSLERGQQGSKFNKHEARPCAYVYANNHGELQLFTFCLFLARGYDSRVTSVHAKHAAQSLLPTSLGSCWTRLTAGCQGHSLFGSSTAHSRQSLQLSGFFPLHPSEARVQLFFPVKPWLSVQRTGRKHFCQQKTQPCTQCSMVKLLGWDNTLVGHLLLWI